MKSIQNYELILASNRWHGFNTQQHYACATPIATPEKACIFKWAYMVLIWRYSKIYFIPIESAKNILPTVRKSYFSTIWAQNEIKRRKTQNLGRGFSCFVLKALKAFNASTLETIMLRVGVSMKTLTPTLTPTPTPCVTRVPIMLRVCVANADANATKNAKLSMIGQAYQRRNPTPTPTLSMKLP